MKKLLVIGLGRHGKDTFCDIATRFGYKSTSSSLFAAEKVVYPALRHLYKSLEECYEDRHNHRQVWYDLITEYNAEDPSRLTRELLERHDIYCGLRNVREVEASKNLFGLVVWVDATKRLGVTETSESITVTRDHADIIIENNGTLHEFENKCVNLLKCINYS